MWQNEGYHKPDMVRLIIPTIFHMLQKEAKLVSSSLIRKPTEIIAEAGQWCSLLSNMPIKHIATTLMRTLHRKHRNLTLNEPSSVHTGLL